MARPLDRCKADLAAANAKITALTADKTALTTENAQLKSQLSTAIAERDKALADLKACRDSQTTPPPTPTGLAKGDSVGGQFTYDFTQADQQKQIDLMKAAGVTWLRIDWASSTSQPRALAQRAHAQGLKILGTILPRGAKSPAEGSAFAKAEAPYMDAMEVGNEYNLWSQYAASPEAYAALYNACKAEVAKVSGIVVMSTGLSPNPGPPEDNSGSLEPRVFLDRALAAGMKPTAIAWHPYCQPAVPSEDWNWSNWTKMKTHHTFTEYPIWITEMGAFTGTHYQAFDETEQAKYVTDTFNEAKKLGIKTPLFWYQGRDGGDDPANDQHRYGVLKRDFSPKAAYNALKAVAV